MKNIAIVYGGFSGERVISEKSAMLVAKHLNPEKYKCWMVDIDRKAWTLKFGGASYPIDINTFSTTVAGEKIVFDGVFCAIHGTPGEDGLLQGYFDMMGIAYNNCGALASAITFDKAVCNRYLKASGVLVADSFIARLGDAIDEDQIITRVGLPCFVKPNRGGSSIGITKVKHKEQLKAAVLKAQEEGVNALIESFVSGTEISCGCIVKDGKPTALAVTEIVPANEFFDFESKYLDAGTQEITPARIEQKVYDECMRLTENIYHWLGCKGMIRVDYILCDRGLSLIEVNTTPGLSEQSIIPQQAVYAGLTLESFFEMQVEEMLMRQTISNKIAPNA